MATLLDPSSELFNLIYIFRMKRMEIKMCFFLVFAESMIQLAQEVCDKIQNCLGIQKFVQVYSQIMKSLKTKRDKRKQEEKRMAVINPMRNAKRKLRIAEKQRSSKRRKITTMRMSRRML